MIDTCLEGLYSTCRHLLNDEEAFKRDHELCCTTDIPELKMLWQMYHDTYQVDVLVVPSTPITARPISDVEPYLNINGRKVPPLPCIAGIAYLGRRLDTQCSDQILEDKSVVRIQATELVGLEVCCTHTSDCRQSACMLCRSPLTMFMGGQ